MHLKRSFPENLKTAKVVPGFRAGEKNIQPQITDQFQYWVIYQFLRK